MAQGVIKRLVKDRGFGFIKPNEKLEGNKDLFFFHAAVKGSTFDSLVEGEKVDFDVEQNEKGPKAVNVRVMP